jgi:transposase
MPANNKNSESIESELVAILLPDLIGLHLDGVAMDDGVVTLTVTSIQTGAHCPVCGQSGSRVHSSYAREPSDLALAGHKVRLCLNVRRFFCSNLACERKTFTERLPGVIKPFARRTDRLAETLCSLGQALGGEAGSRCATHLAIPVSPDTLLRLVRHSGLPPSSTPDVLGVDDWAWKKRQTYGTILVDLERHEVVDLLPDRSADSLAEWLQQHPGVKIITRDRGGIYAEGAQRGAPDAQQVADRFHLLKNLREALEPLLSREHAHLPKLAVSTTRLQDSPPAPYQVLSEVESAIYPATSSDDAAVEQDVCISMEVPEPSAATETALSKPRTRAEQIKHDHRERRYARYQEVIELHGQGKSIHSIAQQIGIARRTVRRYIAAGAFPEIALRGRMPSLLDKFEPYLRLRWREGCHNAMQLYREIHHQGYTGSYPSVSRWAAQIRKTTRTLSQPDTPKTACTAAQSPMRQPENRRKLSPSRAAWLLVRKPADLTLEQKVAVEQMCRASSEIAAAYDLAQDFAHMVREHTADPLPSWLDTARNCRLSEMRSFANGIQRDLAAVTAGLSLPWSNGQVEGQVNRLKLLKRSMYGRAKFDLLKHRLLAPS